MPRGTYAGLMKASTGVTKVLHAIGDDVQTLLLVVAVAEAFARRRRKKSTRER